MPGYLNRKNETNEVIVTDNDGIRWLRTGDLGFVDEDGFVFIKGRLKRIYITRGKDNMAYKLFFLLIEEVITALDEVEECGVVVKEHEEKMNVAIACISLKSKSFSEDEILLTIKNHALAELPEHMIPVEYHIIETMPITPSGKIDYRKLEEIVDNKGA